MCLPIVSNHNHPIRNKSILLSTLCPVLSAMCMVAKRSGDCYAAARWIKTKKVQLMYE